MIPWDHIYRQFAINFHWTPEQVNGLTIRQITVLTMNDGSVREIGSVPKTKGGIKAQIEPSIANLLADRRWDMR